MTVSVTENNNPAQIAAALAKVSIFSKLSTEAIQQLAVYAKPLQLSTGDTLYHKGDPSLYVYIVWHGRLRVSINEATIGYVGRYQPIGEMAAIIGEPRNTNVHAVR
ncbi:MAG TPA: cyclic nucleotide-binding domain-containing protein, partial [Aquirhabdus sp.]